MRSVLLVVVLILSVLVGFASVWLSPLVFGQEGDGESITPVPEPPTPTPEPPTVTPPATTIPPLAPFPPIAPRTDRAFLPVAMRSECEGVAWIFTCEAVR